MTPSGTPLSEVLKRRLPPGHETDGAGTIHPEIVSRTLAVLGIKGAEDATDLGQIIEVLEAGQATGLDPDSLFAAAQAYGRGVGRIVDAEVELPAVSQRGVALVDLVNSTRFLASSTRAETERLVDSLCDAATTCVAARDVLIVKYLGDGFIMVSHDPHELAGAAIDAIETLASSSSSERLPARAGLGRRSLHRERCWWSERCD